MEAWGGRCDAVMLIFVASALPGTGSLPELLRVARALLRPGGRLLFRDYAEFDMPMAR